MEDRHQTHGSLSVWHVLTRPKRPPPRPLHHPPPPASPIPSPSLSLSVLPSVHCLVLLVTGGRSCINPPPPPTPTPPRAKKKKKKKSHAPFFSPHPCPVVALRFLFRFWLSFLVHFIGRYFVTLLLCRPGLLFVCAFNASVGNSSSKDIIHSGFLCSKKPK